MKKSKKTLFLILISLINLSSFAGTYVEFTVKGPANPGAESGIAGKMKAWYQDGNTRSQMQMDLPAGSERIPGFSGMGNLVMLLLNEQPDKTFMLNEKEKTYFEMPKRRGREEQENQEEDFDITIIGKEKINGYNCTHIRARSKSGGPKAEMEWWISQEVPGYQEMKNFRTRQFNTKSMYKALKEKGVEGFPVKILTTNPGRGRNMAMELELVKAEVMDIPESRFSLAGYTKKEGSPFMPGGMDPEKIKNMSPEERMKFFQEMQKMRGMMPKGEGEEKRDK